MEMETQRNLGYPDGPSPNGEVLADKYKSEGAEMVTRKSEGSYYRRRRVMPLEGRTLGKIDLKEETSDEINRIKVKDGNEIGKNKMVI